MAELKLLMDSTFLTITFKAGLDGTQVEANAVTFGTTVYTVKAVPDLLIDTSTMVLDGVHLHQGSPAWWIVKGAPPGASSTRRASGGIGTISYSSSNTSVATVDQNGTVISQSNGTAIITASDGRGERVSYTVQSSNNYTLLESGPGTDMTFRQALNWIAGSNLNHPIPHYFDTPLGVQFHNAFGAFATSGSVFNHHYGTLNSGSQTYTNYLRSTPQGLQALGPVNLNFLARALCYRDR